MKDGTVWCIYTIGDPRTDEVRYVGFTTNPARRFRTHLNPKLAINKHFGNWLTGLLSQGYIPAISIVEVSSNRNWSEREQYWIKHFRNRYGDKLTNKTSGGESGYSLIFTDPAEHARRISAAKLSKHTKRPDCSERLRRLAQQNIGKKMNLSVEERQRRSAFGKVKVAEIHKAGVSETTKNKIRESIRTVWTNRSEEQKATISKHIGDNRRQTHCKRGHVYSWKNQAGHNNCRLCRNERQQIRRAEAKADRS